MTVLLLFLGAVFIGLTWKQAWRQAVDEEKNFNYVQSMVNLGQRVSTLETKLSQLVLAAQDSAAPQDEAIEGMDFKLELLLRAITGLESKVDTLNQKGQQQLENTREKDFAAYIKEASHDAGFKEIRDAYLSGKTVTEIAQEFGKGKGEIELILNLQKSSS
jgi:hypothetical protein